jgi:tRNA 2-thiouridine synthesizing protein A
MNAAMIADTVERLARDIEVLRGEVSDASEVQPARVPDDAGIAGILQGLRDRLGSVEKTLAEIREDVAITAHVDPTAKQAMRKLADFFQEIGGQFSIDSLEVILRQAVSNFCDTGALTEGRDLVDASLEGQYVLDVKGLSCPMPTLRTIKEIEKLAPGEVLQVDGTDISCRKGLPAWCERAGHSYLGEKEEIGYRSFFIRKG